MTSAEIRYRDALKAVVKAHCLHGSGSNLHSAACQHAIEERDKLREERKCE